MPEIHQFLHSRIDIKDTTPAVEAIAAQAHGERWLAYDERTRAHISQQILDVMQQGIGVIVGLVNEQLKSHLDNARLAGSEDGWNEGHKVGWQHCQDGNYGTDYWDDDTRNPYRGARR